MTRAAFLLEQLLGHATHAKNLRRYCETDPGLNPTFIEVPVAGERWKHIRQVQSDIMLRIALDGLVELKRVKRVNDAAFIHTQSAALFCGGMMRSLPTVVSMDATPAQYRRLYHPDLKLPDNLSWKLRLKVKVMQRTDLKRRLLLAAYTNARRLVTWSQWAKDSLSADYGVSGEKVRVVFPGVDTAYYKPDGAQRPGDGVVRLLFVGGDFARKGGQDVLRWARESGAKQPREVHFVTGEKDLADLPPNVFVHNGVTANSPELIRLYQRSDLFVLPTRADAFGIVFLEAMACGLPVVATDIAAVPEMVEDGRTGFLVKPDDFASLAARLDVLVEDAALRREMGERSREHALSKFDQRANYARLVDVVKECAA